MILPRRSLKAKLFDQALSLVIILGSTTLGVNGLSRTRPIQTQTPVDIKFEVEGKPPSDPIKLAVGSKKTIEASVRDQNDNRIRGLVVTWRLANPNDAGFVLLGRQVNGATTNSVEIVGLLNESDSTPPSQVPIIAQCGDVWRVVVVNYIPNTVRTNKLTTDKKEIIVTPGSSDSFTVAVKDEKGADVDSIKIKTKLGPDADKYLTVTSDDDKKTVTVTGKYGDPKKPLQPLFSLIVSAGGASDAVAVRYVYDPVRVFWDVLPGNIVGDNYGRTIKNDYFCIEVTIENFSGEDVALAAFGFDMGDPDNLRPNTSYSTVHGSLERRKLTYPRTLILAAINATGSLMTGFNPFFHNVVHARNFSQGIDIISNPLAKGFALVVPDSYPDELARFERDILKDEKVITSGTIFKTKIFVAKHDVFPTPDYGNKNNIDDVRDALGNLIIYGYKFQRGQLQQLTNTSATPSTPPHP